MSEAARNRITYQEFADILAKFAFSYQASSSAEYSQILKSMGENEKFDRRQEREILIFEMLIITRAVQKIFRAPSIQKIILDSFAHEVLKKESLFSRAEMESLCQKRFQSYVETLMTPTPEGGHWIELGKKFADNLLNKNMGGEAVPFFITVARIFGAMIKATEEQLRALLAQCELGG